MNPTTISPWVQTALFQAHLDLGAKMVPFAGFNMPVSYGGLSEEHHAVRSHCGMFDVSHMAEFRVVGPEALNLIQWISSNDAARLMHGQVQYSCMPNGEGGIVDDLLIYCVSPTEYMLVVNASNRQKDWDWIEAQNKWNADITDESDEWSLIALQGPQATSVLQPLSTTADLDLMKYYTFQAGEVCGADVLISATGYTGAGGFELYMRNTDAPQIWKALLSQGVTPCGLGARDTLRLEAGFCLYGNDIDGETSPIAAGLGWITKFTKEFVDCERLKAEKESGSISILRGFKMLERGIPRSGYTIENSAGKAIGHVTSGTQSPTLGIGIALGYIQKDCALLESEVFIRIRKNAIPAMVVRPGFLPKG